MRRVGVLGMGVVSVLVATVRMVSVLARVVLGGGRHGHRVIHRREDVRPPGALRDATAAADPSLPALERAPTTMLRDATLGNP